MTLILERGQECSLEDLRQIPTPPRTSTFVPISHYDFAVQIASIAQSLLPEYRLDQSRFGTAQNDQQLFGIHTFRTDSEDLGLSFGFRSSLNKSLSAGLIAGSSVLVCSNLCLSSDSQVMRLRKHTTNILDDLEMIIIRCVMQARSTYRNITARVEEMKNIEITDRQAWETLGYLFGNRVLSVRQLPIAYSEWAEPSHPQFLPRTLWSLFNACTESLKSTAPARILEKHLELDRVLRGAV